MSALLRWLWSLVPRSTRYTIACDEVRSHCSNPNAAWMSMVIYRPLELRLDDSEKGIEVQEQDIVTIALNTTRVTISLIEPSQQAIH